MWTSIVIPGFFPGNPKKILRFSFLFGVDNCVIYPHWFGQEPVDNIVDNVDNFLFYQRFSYFYDISGPHSYQQFAVHTLFI